MTFTWYYLDPDNNKQEPKGMHCACCKRSIKETQAVESFTSIVLHEENPWFRVMNGTEKVKPSLGAVIGEKCFQRVKNQFGIMEE